MTGSGHYGHAEQLLEWAGEVDPSDPDREQYLITKAQAHATLALAAAVEKQNRLSHGTDDGGYGAELAARTAGR